MGMIARLPGIGAAARGIGAAVTGVAEVFTVNRTAEAAAEHAEQIAAVEQFGAEFGTGRGGWFDTFVNGLNRLPRPGMAFATMALFAYAMHDPVGFAARMQGLALVPEPLWWLMGAVVSFYFGARELHHVRARTAPSVAQVAAVADAVSAIGSRGVPDRDPNPVIAEWRASQGG